ncbi:hypothetical protein HORM4_1110022 [Vibrio harveyi]|nr:hypothetical protein HORM4_1110022 [Vibrio harveyi]
MADQLNDYSSIIFVKLPFNGHEFVTKAQ